MVITVRKKTDKNDEKPSKRLVREGESDRKEKQKEIARPMVTTPNT